jgi:hypothetical protein
MWLFGNNKTTNMGVDEAPPKPPLSAIVPDRGLHGDNRDPQTGFARTFELRVWLQEPVKLALTEVSKEFERTMSGYVERLFVAHLYGMHELIRMDREQSGIYWQPPPDPKSICRYNSEAIAERIPHLGKNIYGFKMFIAPRIKNDLQAAADRVELPLSRYVRHLLVSHFFGDTFWPHRLPDWFLTKYSKADEWEVGDGMD